MKKKAFQIFCIILLAISAKAQILKPTTWSFTTDKKEVKVGDEVQLIFDAKIQKDWYLYSSDFDPDLGPIVTSMSFTPDASYRLVGKITPVNPKRKHDDIWDGEVSYFKEKGQFTQKVVILKPNPKISGSVEFQTCTEVDGRCVNGNEKFSFNIKTISTSALDKEIDEKKNDKEEVITAENISTLPENELNKSDETNAQVENSSAQEPQKNTNNNPENTPEATSLWKFLLLALGAGFASIFMPCIYPIMPMTVSFFTKQTNGKGKAAFYGFSIMAIFALMGLITMAFGAPFLNFLSTHWIPNTLFFIIFILFGISLLGAFEIVLPHDAVNKIDRLGDKGGLVGIFFMALTLVVVSFSCTVPFVGSLLILSAQGEVWRPLYGMLAFGFPFALVFTSLAMFPQWLKNLPKSGGWLNELKAVFGFMEFALALKFLSNIDLAYHWNLLHRNVFILLWVVLFVLAGLYILGFIRLSKDEKVSKLSWQRVFFAAIFLGFSAYMVPGVTGKSLGALSGILPPMPVDEVSADQVKLSKGMKKLPHGLVGFKDLDDAMVYAQQVNKPILIDFTGYACANCRKMEEFVWPEPQVLEKLKKDFVIASLYVDDKEELPKEKHYQSSYDKELKTTVGAKNMDLEITKFNNNAQPYYAVVDAKGNKLMEPIGYTTAEKFAAFLTQGKDKF